MENRENKPQVESNGSQKQNKKLVMVVAAITVLSILTSIVAVAIGVNGDNNNDSSVKVEKSEKPKRKINLKCGEYPFTATRKVVFRDLIELDKEEYRIMRNEIFARHGHIFQDESLRTYFESQPWYEPSDEEVKLSKIEQYNVNFIKKIADEMAQVAWLEYDLNTYSKKITEDDIYYLNKRDLRILRNEIYARYGYIFDDPALVEEFKYAWWYTPVTKKVTLTDIEKHNVEVIRRKEKQLAEEEKLEAQRDSVQ